MFSVTVVPAKKIRGELHITSKHPMPLELSFVISAVAYYYIRLILTFPYHMS